MSLRQKRKYPKSLRHEFLLHEMLFTVEDRRYPAVINTGASACSPPQPSTHVLANSPVFLLYFQNPIVTSWLDLAVV